MIAEFKLIEKIKKQFLVTQKNVIGIGDDCAVIKTGDKYLLYTIDSMVQDVHFDFDLPLSWDDVGYKAIVRAISDIAAMGGTPEYVLIALSLRKDFTENMFKHLLNGIELAVKKYDIRVIGGDISSSKVVSITISAIGSSKNMPVLRSGAKIKDDIYVTGYTGLSSIGLYILKEGIKTKKSKIFIDSYKRPRPRIDVGIKLINYASAMIDISDGLIGDLKHILEESKVGAIIEKHLIPVHDSFFKIAPLMREGVYEHILNGGDDYELLFTAPPEYRGEIEKLSIELKTKITRIGSIIKKGLYIKEDDKTVPLKSSSYEHFKS